jgi:uncharacterized glyoxalase superfamily protein PhnB
MPTPYLFFDGRCEEAIEFYKKALGAKVEMMMRFKDSPEPPPPGRVAPGSDNKIMHSCLSINGESVMASDGCAGRTIGMRISENTDYFGSVLPDYNFQLYDEFMQS